MEQLAARWAHNPKVVGSSPAPATLDPLKSLISEGFSFCADKMAPNNFMTSFEQHVTPTPYLRNRGY